MRRGGVAAAVVSAIVWLPTSPIGCAHGLELDLEPLPGQAGGGPTGQPPAVGPGTGGQAGDSSSGGSAGSGDSQGIGGGGAMNVGGAGGSGGSGASGSAGTGGLASGGAAGASGADGGVISDGSAADHAGDGHVSDGNDGNVGLPCASNPLSPRTMWTASASQSSLGNGTEGDTAYNPPSHAIDGNVAERWSTGKPQAGDEWLQINFGRTVAIDRITLQPDAMDFPRGYAVRVSSTSMNFAAPVLASGAGQAAGNTVINLTTPAVGRYLLISQTGTNTLWWSVAELTVGCTD